MNTNIPTQSTIHNANKRAMRGSIYKTEGAKTVCPIAGRQFVARIHVTSGGFMVNQPNGGSVQQYTWEAKGGREALMSAVRYLAKRTLEKSFAGKYGDVGFVRTDFSCELPTAALAAWGYDRENSAEGSVSVSVPYFDVLV